MSAIPAALPPVNEVSHVQVTTSVPMSPNQRAWARFKRNRLGYYSLWVFGVLLVLATFAELISNDRPLVARYDGKIYFPLIANPPERQFGGDFGTPTDWKDPLIRAQFAKPGNWALFTLNEHSDQSQDYFQKAPSPAAPSADDLLGTDGDSQDMVAKLIYGFRVSIWFAFALTVVGTVLGVLAGAVQGYFGGRTDLFLQRIFEIWGAVPEL
ncbi:MAG TPA: ABC transporter permease, partial [Burkholderiaceae bacterium]|nr:ABC transporter permease [Burkholderiaceae bacterium]